MFVDLFKIPFNDGIEYDNNTGRPELQRLGCCCKEIVAKRKTQYKIRMKKLIEANALTQEDSDWLTKIEQEGFQNSICIKEKNHKGRCSRVPYLPKEFKFGKTPKENRDPFKVGVNGIIAKIKDPVNNPGGDPCPLQNRGGSRNNITMLDKNTEKQLRQYAKDKRKEKYYVNLGIRLSMGATKYMIATAVLDMFTMIYFTKDAKGIFEIPKNFENILKQRWEELKNHHLNDGLIIFDRYNNLQDPVDHRTIDIKDYGVGHTDLRGIQFGHIKPIREDKWMSRGGNVMPLPRGSNLKQSNSDLKDVPLDQLKHAKEQVSRLKELGCLSEDYKTLLKEIVDIAKDIK
jgi:hypothetical protein